VTSAVVLHELWFGIDRLPPSRRRTDLERFLREFMSGVPVLSYGQRAARWHATERARLARGGHSVPFADGQIAATASVNEAILVTANRKHFELLEGLRLESWE
jgi:tRNA(fMet)-specific endonuclease VapC